MNIESRSDNFKLFINDFFFESLAAGSTLESFEHVLDKGVGSSDGLNLGDTIFLLFSDSLENDLLGRDQIECFSPEAFPSPLFYCLILRKF